MQQRYRKLAARAASAGFASGMVFATMAKFATFATMSALVATLAFATMRPALAVDRGLGVDVPKPVASGAPWTADDVSLLRHDVDALLDGAPTLRGAHVGVLAVETRSGNLLYARNPDDAFVPASTFKLLTGSAALALLGPDHRLRTEALVDPGAERLVIRGGGDPLLRAADLDDMARTVRAAGVARLRSGVWIDTSAFEPAPYPPGWCWDDFPFYYSAVISAATVEENVVHLTVSPGATSGARVVVHAAPAPFDADVGTPSEGCPFTRSVEVLPQARTGDRGSPDTLDVARTTGGCIIVTGSLPLGSAPETVDAAVPSPVQYLRGIAIHALDQAGVTTLRAAVLAGPVEATDGEAGVEQGSRVVWTHDGEPLSDLLADLWWPSDNLVGELLLREIGRRTAGSPGTTIHGAAAERAWLQSIGVDPATLTIADGSGLSSYDRITPRALVGILQADWNGPYRDIVVDDLPLAGVRGTVAHDYIGTPAARRTFAKTGSMNHTRGLAGFVATLRHGAVTFAWSVDDWMGTQSDLDALRAAVLTRLIDD